METLLKLQSVLHADKSALLGGDLAEEDVVVGGEGGFGAVARVDELVEGGDAGAVCELVAEAGLEFGIDAVDVLFG